jgi:hypothetical protein
VTGERGAAVGGAQLTVARELLRTGYLVRSLRSSPLVVAGVTVAAILALHPAPVTGVGPARVVVLILVLGSGFAFDDPAAPTLQASPYPLARRFWLRIGCAAAVTIALWTVALVRLLPPAPPLERMSLALGLTVELLAALSVVWASAAWGRRRGVHEPGPATAPVLIGLLFVTLLQEQAPLFVGPGPQWLAAHLRWAAVLALGAALLAAAMRDPR